MPKPETLLVTGGCGLAMSQVARAWLERDPEAEAILLDQAPPDPVVEAFFAPVAGRLTVLQGDLRDPDLWDRLPAVSHVAHGAAVTSINRLTETDGLEGALPALEANIMGTARLLAWAARQSDLRRLVYVSSGSVYGDAGPDPLPEEGFVAPEGFYPISKYVGELLSGQAARQFGLPAVAVRLSGVYGPLDRETGTRAVKSVPYRLMHAALAGRALGVAGLAAVGDYISAGDVGQAIVALLNCPAPGHRVYNIAYGQSVALGDLLGLVERLVPGARFQQVAPEAAELVCDPAQRRGRWGAYDIARMTEDCGWRPRPLETALADYRDWLKKHPY
ncbi:MAG: NAD(P)-dependent oxidoreductase [Pseudomonadota bacterium]